MEQRTEVFQIRDGVWWAVWKGKAANADFNSKGAALAWVAVCNSTGKWRA